MAAKRRGGPRPQVKGFRPGKEPAHLKKQRAKAQLGSDATWAQKRAVDAVVGRSPEDVQAMVRTWSIVLIVAAVGLLVGGVFLYAWHVAAGVTAHVLAAAVGFLGYRVRTSGRGLVEMAESM